MRTETDLKEDILEVLKKVPDSVAIKIAGNAFQESGLPDILFTCSAIGGRAIVLELKKPGEEPRKLQEYKIAKFSRAGAYACVVQSLSEVLVILEYLGVRGANGEVI